MASIQSLPDELLKVIFDYCSMEDSPHIRLVSPRWEPIARERVFRKLVLGTRTESVESFSRILSSTKLRECVKQLTFKGLRAGQMLYERGTSGAADLPEKVARSFRSVQYFQNLESLHINLRWNLHIFGQIPDEVAQRSLSRNPHLVLGSMLTSDDLSPNIKTLAISNLPSRDDPSMKKGAFSSFFGQLSTLRLAILMHNNGFSGIYNHTQLSMECLDFFAKLPAVWLTPGKNISTLTLYSNDHWGYYPKVDLEKTYFPSLQVLILGELCFSHDSKLQWLLKHADSLQSLYLFNCSILREVYFLGQQDEDGYPIGRIRPGDADQRTYTYNRYWHYYFTQMS